MKILVTGAAGFIGMHTAIRLLERGNTVVGIDNINDYYSPQLKLDRLARLKPYPGFSFEKLDIADRFGIEALFAEGQFNRVIHLAAQAGVRYSLTNPHAYAESNLVGFINVLEACRQQKIEHLVYASSSSVYGGNTKMPFTETDAVNHPVSLYAATKKANELMAHTYSHLYKLPTTGLRFFTVYGPWGRPDMAYFSFTKNILEGDPIKIFNNGEMKRDFTYIDDIVGSIVTVSDHPALSDTQFNSLQPNAGTSTGPYRIYNIGNQNPVNLSEFIRILERYNKKKSIQEFLPMQPGDVVNTYADVSAISKLTNSHPTTSLDQGLKEFVNWYREYYSI